MQISVALYPRFSNLCLANTIEPLRAANDLGARTLFEWEVVSMDGKPVTSSSGLELAADRSLRDATGDALILLPSYGYAAAATHQGRAALRAAAGRFDLLAGFDMGAWLLADAGLLEGHRATIHWDEIAAFEEAFPEVEVSRARHIADGKRLTNAGGATALETMLDLVEQQGGAALRLDVALLFIQPGAADRSTPEGAYSRRVSQLLELMSDTLEDPLPVHELARRAGLSLRSVERLTQSRLSTTPAALYRRLRLLRARKLARETDMPVAEIALRTGYADASAMTRAFRKHFGQTPRSYRNG